MKKLLIIFTLALLVMGCTRRVNLNTGTSYRELTATRMLTILPNGFQYVSNAGNGWHMFRHESGNYLVSIQGAGAGEGGTFIQMTWIGK